MDNLKQLIECNCIVVVDLETTGLDRNTDFIIEVGAVKIDKGEINEKYYSLVNNPQMQSLPEEIERLTGITFEQLKTAPFVGEVLKGLFEFSRSCIIVAHNIPFDFAFLRNWGFWYGVPFDEFKDKVIDTVALAKQVLGDKVKNYKLSTLADYFNIEFNHHRALDDAEATAKILIELSKYKTVG